MSYENSFSIEVQLSQLDNTKAYQKATLCVSSPPLIDVEPMLFS